MATSVPYQIPKVVISYLFARWCGRASTGRICAVRMHNEVGEKKWQEALDVYGRVKLLESVGARFDGTPSQSGNSEKFKMTY
jgi:hypothetical protein